MQNPANLQVYHRALDLAARVHEHAEQIPSGKAPGLASQMARAASSIAANIAEGVGHPSQGRCPFHLSVAIASAFEVETHLRLAARVVRGFGDINATLDELQQVRRMLYALREYKRRQLLERKNKRRP
ncbi:four helix bundle protein [Gemmatimonas sp.]|jgi:four helix bundle protein|uniref:four helix bundle protein n=1 Tax=Gemmatimonas sp. TaxID=1962908 RepID=UPI0022BF1B9D|nr:four helix bundle protein [Gemmatimonas sp.]MCZ8206247.1 four helix bundle protein [Gemmatimonas sp.]